MSEALFRSPRLGTVWSMGIDQWPIVARPKVVRAFKPGELATREGPFRTLRSHRWATAGVRVATRNASHASGQFTIFSVLNVEAARLAREGLEKHAVVMARIAAQIESSSVFSRLEKLLGGRATEEVSSAVEGSVPEARWPELHQLLRLIARETKSALRSNANLYDPVSMNELRQVFAGRVHASKPEYLVLRDALGKETAVPRSLARAAHREEVGDFLAVITDRLDEGQMVVNAVPAIDIDEGSSRQFNPFSRNGTGGRISKADVRLLSRMPATLRVMVPVTIAS